MPRSPSRPGAAWSAVALVLAAILIATLAGELVLRLPAAVTIVNSTWFRPDPRFGVRVRADRPLPAGGRTDSAGFNNLPAEGRGEPEILFVGDSMTFGTLPATQVFPHLTATGFGDLARARNLGIPSIGPHEYLAVTEDIAVPARPDLVVVTLYLGNDLYQADPALRTRLYLGEPKALPDPGRIPRRLDELFVSRLAALAWRTVRRVFGGCYGRDLAWSNEFLRMVYQQELVVVLSDRADWYVDRLVDRAADMHAVLETAGIPSLFVVVPSELQLNPALRREVAGCLGRADGEVAYPAHDVEVSRQLGRRGIDHLDLTPALSRETNRVRLFNGYDTHLNAAGNRVVAEQLVAKLRNRWSVRQSSP